MTFTYCMTGFLVRVRCKLQVTAIPIENRDGADIKLTGYLSLVLDQIQGQVHPDPQHQVFPGGEQSGYGPHPSWGSVYFLAWVLAMKPLNIITSFDA